MNFFLSHLVRGLRPLVLIVLPVVALGAAPLPFCALHENPVIALPTVSPKGDRIAFRAEIEGIQYLALMDIPSMQPKLVAKFETTRLQYILWKGDDFLMLAVSQEGGGTEYRSFDMKTQQVVSLADHVFFSSGYILSLLPDDPEHIVVSITSVNGAYLGKFNLRTGKMEVLQKPEGTIFRWFANKRGEAIAALLTEKHKLCLRWRPSVDSPWQQAELGDEKQKDLRVIQVHPDQKRLLAWDSSQPGGDALVALDPATLAREVIFKNPDFDGERVTSWIEDPSDVTAVTFEADRPRFHYLDPEAAKVQATLDGALPKTTNEILNTSRDHGVVVFLAHSDQDSGQYLALDRKNRRVLPIGDRFSSRNPAAAAPSRAFSFKSRDGLMIHGRLWTPPGNPEHPPVLVMLGPQLVGPRSRYVFAPIPQVFATRGYAVAIIDTRGTPGYGKAFQAAGDYQFATGIVDDVYAGLDYIQSQGWADATRAGLFTTGWGGVAGLPALTKSDRFKVWIDDATNLDSSLRPADLSVSDQDKDLSQILTALGGRAAVNALMDSIDAKELLTRVTVPSFHLSYNDYGRSVGAHAELARSKIKTTPDRNEVVGFDNLTAKKKGYADEYKAREKMLAFLAKWLPPAAPAK